MTALHLAVHRRAGIITFHGPGAAWNPRRTGTAAAAQLRRLLMDRGAPGTMPGRVVADGTGEGVLVGGNLSLLAASIGTPDHPDLAGGIVFLEDVGEPAYRLDRMLTHLLRSGLLDDVAGVVLGETEVVGEGPPFEEIALERLGRLGVPIVGGVAAGHGPGQITLPLGAAAVVRHGELVIGDPVTS